MWFTLPTDFLIIILLKKSVHYQSQEIFEISKNLSNCREEGNLGFKIPTWMLDSSVSQFFSVPGWNRAAPSKHTATCSLKLLTQFFDEIDFLSIFLSCSALQLMGKLLELNELSQQERLVLSRSMILSFAGFGD